MQCLTHTQHTQLGSSRQAGRQKHAAVGACRASSVLPTSSQSCLQRLGWQQQQQQSPQGRWQQRWQQPNQQQQQPYRAAVVPAAGPPEHIDTAGSKKRLAVFVSGGGSNFKAIHAACQKGTINAEVVAVVSDVPSCGGVSYAKEHGIAVLTYPASKKGLFPGLSSEELVAALTQTHQADYVLLAGFLKLIPVELCHAFKRKMLNIHPGLLPSFGGKGYYGERVHTAVLASGARYSGPTVHFVDAEYDTGPILAQRVVPVYPTDTPKQLAARVLEQEHQVYPYAVSALVDGRITFREDGIPIIWEAR